MRFASFGCGLLLTLATQNAGPKELDGRTMERMRELQGERQVQRAFALLDERATSITDLQVQFAKIPSPDHRAAERAALLRKLMHEMDLQEIRSDAAGNVIGVLPGAQRGAGVILLSAHLDTVFPELAEIEITRDGDILRGPGISDDAAGLAAAVYLMRALRESGVRLQRDVVLVGTVGEEGEGDLRGVKHLFDVEYPPERVFAFITLDLGAHAHAVNSGLGSRRLQVTITGPGGHSWGDFGRPNPIHALTRGLGRFLERVEALRGRTSYNVGTIEGGRGVNVIPETASVRVDLRSESPQSLADIEKAFRAAIAAGVEHERRWSRGDARLHVTIEVIGDRPVGETPVDSELIRTLHAAFAAQRLKLDFGRSSTDANVPMSLGVPAVALPHGVFAENAHSLNEWCDVRGREAVLKAEFLALVALAGFEPQRPESTD